LNNTIQGGCSSPSWQQGPELDNIAVHMNAAGYTRYDMALVGGRVGEDVALVGVVCFFEGDQLCDGIDDLCLVNW
jgi:hypothetical protein